MIITFLPGFVLGSSFLPFIHFVLFLFPAPHGCCYSFRLPFASSLSGFPVPLRSAARSSSPDSTARGTFLRVIVPARMLQHGWGNDRGRFRSPTRACGFSSAHARFTGLRRACLPRRRGWRRRYGQKCRGGGRHSRRTTSRPSYMYRPQGECGGPMQGPSQEIPGQARNDGNNGRTEAWNDAKRARRVLRHGRPRSAIF